MKVLNLKGASKDVVEGLTEEINLLKSLSHHNIVRYIGHLKKNRNELCIVMVCTISKIPMILLNNVLQNIHKTFYIQSDHSSSLISPSAIR